MLYGIRIGQWVEVRSSPTPPKAVTSKVTIGSGKKLKELRQTIYNGGSVLGILDINQFIHNAKVFPRPMIQVPQDREDAVLKRLKK